jgi:hypothetical protein
MISSGHGMSLADDGDLDKVSENWANMFGPGHLDQSVRQVINTCWMMLPKERKTHENVEQEVRRLMERALQDFREDCHAFVQPKMP